MTYNCSLYSAGKQSFGNYDSLSIWRFVAIDNSNSGAFSVGTVWGISLPKLPDLFVAEPRNVFSPLLKKHPAHSELADDRSLDLIPVDSAKFPVITRKILDTTDATKFGICFIATTIENQGTAEQNLLGVALVMGETQLPGLYHRIDAKLLVGPALVTSRGSPKEKEKITRMF